LRAASSDLPGRQRGGAPVPAEPERPSLFGLAPGGACRAPFLAVGAVGSYPTVSPLPDGAEAGSGGL